MKSQQPIVGQRGKERRECREGKRWWGTCPPEPPRAVRRFDERTSSTASSRSARFMFEISTCFSAYTRPLSLRTALYTVPNDPFAMVTSGEEKSASAMRRVGASSLSGTGLSPRCDCDSRATPEPTFELLVRYISARARRMTKVRARCDGHLFVASEKRLDLRFDVLCRSN